MSQPSQQSFPNESLKNKSRGPSQASTNGKTTPRSSPRNPSPRGANSTAQPRNDSSPIPVSHPNDFSSNPIHPITNQQITGTEEIGSASFNPNIGQQQNRAPQTQTGGGRGLTRVRSATNISDEMNQSQTPIFIPSKANPQSMKPLTQGPPLAHGYRGYNVPSTYYGYPPNPNYYYPPQYQQYNQQFMAPPQPVHKNENRRIPIIDPKTGKDIIDSNTEAPADRLNTPPTSTDPTSPQGFAPHLDPKLEGRLPSDLSSSPPTSSSEQVQMSPKTHQPIMMNPSYPMGYPVLLPPQYIMHPRPNQGYPQQIHTNSLLSPHSQNITGTPQPPQHLQQQPPPPPLPSEDGLSSSSSSNLNNPKILKSSHFNQNQNQNPSSQSQFQGPTPEATSEEGFSGSTLSGPPLEEQKRELKSSAEKLKGLRHQQSTASKDQSQQRPSKKDIEDKKKKETLPGNVQPSLPQPDNSTELNKKDPQTVSAPATAPVPTDSPAPQVQAHNELRKSRESTKSDGRQQQTRSDKKGGKDQQDQKKQQQQSQSQAKKDKKPEPKISSQASTQGDALGTQPQTSAAPAPATVPGPSGDTETLENSSKTQTTTPPETQPTTATTPPPAPVPAPLPATASPNPVPAGQKIEAPVTLGKKPSFADVLAGKATSNAPSTPPAQLPSPQPGQGQPQGQTQTQGHQTQPKRTGRERNQKGRDSKQGQGQGVAPSNPTSGVTSSTPSKSTKPSQRPTGTPTQTHSQAASSGSLNQTQGSNTVSTTAPSPALVPASTGGPSLSASGGEWAQNFNDRSKKKGKGLGGSNVSSLSASVGAGSTSLVSALNIQPVAPKKENPKDRKKDGQGQVQQRVTSPPEKKKEEAAAKEKKENEEKEKERAEKEEREKKEQEEAIKLQIEKEEKERQEKLERERQELDARVKEEQERLEREREEKERAEREKLERERIEREERERLEREEQERLALEHERQEREKKEEEERLEKERQEKEQLEKQRKEQEERERVEREEKERQEKELEAKQQEEEKRKKELAAASSKDEESLPKQVTSVSVVPTPKKDKKEEKTKSKPQVQSPTTNRARTHQSPSTSRAAKSTPKSTKDTDIYSAYHDDSSKPAKKTEQVPVPGPAPVVASEVPLAVPAPIPVQEPPKPEPEAVENENAEDEDDDWEKKDLEEIKAQVSLRPNTGSKPFSSAGLKTTIDVVYPDGSWRPETTKKMYDRDFLLRFQSICQDRPDGLPSIEVILGSESENSNKLDKDKTWNRNTRTPQSSRMADNNYPNSPQNRHGRDSGKMSRNNKGYQKTPKLTRSPPPGLRHPHIKDRLKIGQTDPEDKVEQINRQVQGLLNKITPETFDSISNKILAILTSDKDVLESVIARVFDKALAELKFCKMYADLCYKMNEQLNKLAALGAEGQKTNNFKLILLNKCQFEFENKPPHPPADLPADQKEEAHVKRRTRVMGNIHFIGELFKKRMLSEKVMHECIKRMLGNGEIGSITPEDIECLCKLLSNIGAELDHEKSQKWMQEYFNYIDQLSRDKNFDSRIRFMLVDLIELRENRWIPRIKKDNPKKLKEIHKDIHQEAVQHQMNLRNPAPPSRIGILSKKEPPRTSTPKPDQWSTVPGRGGSDISKRKDVSHHEQSEPKPRITQKPIHDPNPHTSNTPSSTTTAPVPAPAPAPAPVASSVDPEPETVERKTEELVQEFMDNRILEEAADCVRDIKAPKMHDLVLNRCLMLLIEKKSSDQQPIEDLIAHLYHQGLFSKPVVLHVLGQALENLYDLKMDIPQAPTILGRMIGRLVKIGALENSILTRTESELKEFPQELEGVVVALISNLSKYSSEAEMNKFGSENGQVLVRLFKEFSLKGDKLKQFLDETKLQSLSNMLIPSE